MCLDYQCKNTHTGNYIEQTLLNHCCYFTSQNAMLAILLNHKKQRNKRGLQIQWM